MSHQNSKLESGTFLAYFDGTAITPGTIDFQARVDTLTAEYQGALRPGPPGNGLPIRQIHILTAGTSGSLPITLLNGTRMVLRTANLVGITLNLQIRKLRPGVAAGPTAYVIW